MQWNLRLPKIALIYEIHGASISLESKCIYLNQNITGN